MADHGDQPRLFYESLLDVLRAVVAACGGLKEVGRRLYPEKSPDDAARYLADCLNFNRAAVLGPEQLVLLLHVAKEHGVHLGVRWICDDLGYTRPSPVEPEDQIADLQRQWIQSVDHQRALAERMERLMVRDTIRTVAR